MTGRKEGKNKQFQVCCLKQFKSCCAANGVHFYDCWVFAYLRYLYFGIPRWYGWLLNLINGPTFGDVNLIPAVGETGGKEQKYKQPQV